MALIIKTQKGLNYFNNSHIKKAVLLEQFDVLQIFMADGFTFFISKVSNKKIGGYITDVTHFDISDSSIEDLFFSCVQ